MNNSGKVLASLLVFVISLCLISTVEASTILESAVKQILVPTEPVPGWNTLGFDDSGWTSGSGGVGYDTTTYYDAYFNTDVQTTMYTNNGTCYIRIPFTFDGVNNLDSAVLRMRYDDGFIAYINGIKVAEDFPPTPPLIPQYYSFSSGGRGDPDCILLSDFDVTTHIGAMRDGDNVLAIQGLNLNLTSSDFLISAKLELTLSVAPKAHTPNPVTQTTGIALTTDLNWTPGVEATSQDVYFGTVSGSLSQITSGNGTLNSVSNALITPLNLDTTYYWRVDTDGNTGTEWSFTTYRPKAATPAPTNNQTSVSIYTNLGWLPDTIATTQNVYFGTVSGSLSQVTSGNVMLNSASNAQINGPLTFDKTYYWRIDTDGFTGDEWSFDTRLPVPNSVSPDDGQIRVAIGTGLQWTPDSEAISQQVYFGTESGNLSAITSSDGSLSSITNALLGGDLLNNSTYYWRVDTNGSIGSEWSFVTNEVNSADLDQSGFVDISDLIILVEQWLDQGGCSGLICADLNTDFSVDSQDFSWMADFWQKPVAQILINEFMASNNSTIEDPQEAGESPDWIELYNASAKTLDLGGMYLTDDLSNPTKWQIPASITIDPSGFLVFWADDDDEQGDYHTNFRLSAGGEEIGLFDSSSVLIDSIDFSTIPQTTDISYGRYADGDNDLRFFSIPTPGLANDGAYAGLVDDTKFSHDRGFYTSEFSVIISSDTEGAEIRYTLDGSTPTEMHGSIYSAPVEISNSNGTATLRAAAFKPGWMSTNIDTHTYIFANNVKNQITPAPGVSPATGWPPQCDLPPVAVPNYNTTLIYDYGMDPDVVNDPAYSDLIDDALLSLPTISIVTDLPNLFHPTTGIYSNPLGRDIAWERPASVELINPDGTEGFQINAGLRLRGNSGRLPISPKHSWRLFFRSEYGNSTLGFPLFGDEGVDEFDKIDLRDEHTAGWSWLHDPTAVFVKDLFTRLNQKEMGHPYTRGHSWYHMYLNGHYWGTLHTQERAEANFAATNYGGDREDYDALKAYGVMELLDGNFDAYNRLWQEATAGFASNFDYYRVQGMNTDGTRNPAYERLLDVDNVIDYMLINFFVGNLDGPVNSDVIVANFRAFYNRVNPDGWKFVHHDTDLSMLTLDWDVTGPFVTGQNFEHFNPHWLHQRLTTNVDYKIRFADRVYKHFFNAGLLTPQTATANFLYLTNQIEMSIIAESARWGDAKNSNLVPADENTIPLTKNDWIAAVNSKINDFFNASPLTRTDIVLNQIKADNWYPNIDPPIFYIDGMQQHNGYVAPGVNLTMANPNGSGTMYYTVDGTDPRETLTGNAVGNVYGSAVTLTTSTRVKARILNGSTWSALHESTYAIGLIADNLRITEIMYHPEETGSLDDPDEEFIELKNIGSTAIDISWAGFTNGIDFTFVNTQLASGELVVVVADKTIFENKYGTGVNIAGEYSGKLANDGEKIELVDAAGTAILNFKYEDGWRDVTDGDGYSLVINDATNPDVNSWDDKHSWSASTPVGGTPGTEDTGPRFGDIVINEILAHSDDYPDDWIELHNTSNSNIDISGWFLSDNALNLKKYLIPSTAPISPDGYAVFTQADDFGGAFGFSENGEIAYLSGGIGGTLTGYRETEDFDASENGVSFGRYQKSNSTFNFVPMTSNTPGSANSSPLVGPIVISEIMYNPLSGIQDQEYIELYNISSLPVTLYDFVESAPWKFTDGIDFTFPDSPATTIGVGQYLIIAKNPTAFTTYYGTIPGAQLLGPYDGNLSNGGEKLQLDKPGELVSGTRYYIRIDRISYDDESPWPTEPDGTNGNGSSLSRITAGNYGNDVVNWRSAVPSPGTTNP